MRIALFITLNFFVILMAGIAHAGFIAPGLESQLKSMEKSDVVKVLVVMDQQADIRALDWDLHNSKASMNVRHETVLNTLQIQAKTSQSKLLSDLENNKASGAILGYTSHWIVNSIVVTGTVEAIRQLAARSDVERVEADLVVELIRPVKIKNIEKKDSRGIGITPGVVAVGARRVWDELGVDGSGVIVGNLDTGVAVNHIALGNRWRGHSAPAAECWLDAGGTGYSTPTDLDGHGSHVMGTITGLAPGDTIGVAPGALWIASNISTYPENDLFFDNGVIASLEFMADPDNNPLTLDDMPVVVHNSWGVFEDFAGYYDCDSRWWDAIDNCEAAGVCLTWSAGNEGPGGTSMRSPADRATSPTNCFSIGSTLNFPPYEISYFSSRGPSGCGGEFAMKPEIMAPGTDIYSVRASGGYLSASGTSMSGPHVAGVVALMRAANPNVDVITVKEILMATAIDLGAPGEDGDYGHGFVDAYEAVLAVIDGVGTVEGYITDNATGLPVDNALVKKLGASYSTFTDPNGFFSLTISSGVTDFEVSRFGYNDALLNVTIPDNGTVSGDMVLVPFPIGTVGGYVYDPDGIIVPGATVTAVGTPLAPVVADENGFYSLALPSGPGLFYSLRSRSIYHGQQTHDVEMTGDMTLNFNLPELQAEDFESGDFGSYQWDHGQNPWGISSNDAQEGTYCAQSSVIVDEQSSQLSISMEIADPGLLTFWYKTSCELNWDFLRFYIDGELQEEWSGEVPWSEYSVSIAPGIHTFQWAYEKDGSDAEGDDACYIDFIEFPQQGLIGTPSIELDATSFTAYLDADATEDQYLNIENTGDGRLHYFIRLVDGEKEERGTGNPLTGFGGPDAFGYRWTDSYEANGPVYNWIDISGSGSIIDAYFHSNTGPYELGFDFSYYGNTFDSIRVCSTGWLSFTSDSNAFNNQGLPHSSEPNNMLAVFWDDLNLDNGGAIYYQALADKFIVQFEDVRHFLGSHIHETFQVILYSDGSIVYQYKTVTEGDGCSVGIENATGTDGLQVAFNSNYLQDGLAIRFSTQPPLSWVIPDPGSGSVEAGESELVALHFDATDLAEGTYEVMMTVISDDLVAGDLDLPVTLIIGEEVSAVGEGLPKVLQLAGAVPNPFNPRTDIKFSLPRESSVQLKLYDVSGRLVRSLVDETMASGAYSVRWSGHDDAGKSVASGTYFMRLVADGEIRLKSMVLIR